VTPASDVPWRTDVEVDTEACRSIVSRRFPRLAGRPVRPLGDGWCFRAFLLGDDLVAKFPKREDVVEDLVGEIAFLDRPAGRLPVEIAVPVERGEPGSDFPFLFAIQTRVRGIPAIPADLDPQERDRIVRDALNVLEALKTADPAEDWPGTGRWPSPEMLAVSRSDVSSLLDRIGPALGVDLDATFRDFYAGTPPPPAPGPPVLAHGDLVPEHLYLDAKTHRLTGLIDWGDACFGDPAQDVAGLGFLVPPERMALWLDDADPGILERARYRVLAAAAHTIYFGVRESNERYRESGLRTLDRWLPRR
jgi:aminoglycoside phosphotransferase (APT) family kinase protein